MDAAPRDATELLIDAGKGDAGALGAMLPLVYDELRRLARASLGRERPGHTLQPTALVHEVHLRLSLGPGDEGQPAAEADVTEIHDALDRQTGSTPPSSPPDVSHPRSLPAVPARRTRGAW
jgi:hypothetical protein